MANLDSILKSKDLTSPAKFHIAKAMVFPVAVYGCENWTIKKAEHHRIDAFFFNFYFYFILLYNTVLVLPYIDMNPPRVYLRSQT